MTRLWKLAAGAGPVLGCVLLTSGAALQSNLAWADDAAPGAPSPAAGPPAPAPSAPASATSAPASASGTSAHISASWQKHQVSFQYMGFTTTYSCDGLADKLKILLIAAGARADAKAQPGACAAPYGRPDKFARADLTFYSLAPLAQGATDKPVDAQWRAVTLGARSPRNLAIGDCEAVEQFQHDVLPMFTTRNVVDNTACIPHQESGSLIDLRFEVLAAVPHPGAPKTH